jgi:hypothetical protein
MTNRTIHQNNGFSKKELIEIIEEIDADKNQMKNQAEKPNSYRKDNYSYSIGGHAESR